MAVLALVVSRLDYCNGLPGATVRLFDKLQRIQNRAARLVARPRVTHGQILHITPVSQQLHWLLVRHRATYQYQLWLHANPLRHVFRCLHGTAPPYLTELLHSYTRYQLLQPASHLQLTLCWPKSAVGRAGFRVARPAAWNTLPSSLGAAELPLCFEKQLNTYLCSHDLS